MLGQCTQLHWFCLTWPTIGAAGLNLPPAPPHWYAKYRNNILLVSYHWSLWTLITASYDRVYVGQKLYQSPFHLFVSSAIVNTLVRKLWCVVLPRSAWLPCKILFQKVQTRCDKHHNMFSFISGNYYLPWSYAADCLKYFIYSNF